jgi:hypothetical protein
VFGMFVVLLHAEVAVLSACAFNCVFYERAKSCGRAERTAAANLTRKDSRFRIGRCAKILYIYCLIFYKVKQICFSVRWNIGENGKLNNST